LAGLIAEQKAAGLSKQAAEEVYTQMLESGDAAKEALAKLGIQAVDAAALAEIVRRAIAANPKAVAEYKKGKAAAANSFMGPVMRETKGAAKADVVQQLILEELRKA
jgi:aspartyl-tRNA(Asn)/glutamyl-tRNA(Gln) amidotransferase subunit B